MDVRRWIPFSILITLFLIPTVSTDAQEQLWVGPNVNMVSGTTWPDGDPFLQRQNEPSVAVSTRNPLHLLAGANDYRAVDIPGLPEGKETGDSWLGVFKSLDGGSTWRSSLLPGYPQDTTPTGLASPLHGYDAGADPVVRAGTDGLFYYAGIVFLRENLAESAVFVARFEDLNNDERGDPIAHIDTQIVATGSGNLFVDKPWMAVDRPRGGHCGNVYVAWAEIDSSDVSPTSVIMFSRSTDCGATWSAGIPLSAAGTLPQGATIAVAPTSGKVYVAWRQHTTLSLTATDCFFGGGVWKNAPEMWPVEFITMGGVTYSKQEAIDILNTSRGGDATYILAKQLIPAKLNFEVNNVSAEIQAIIDAGDQWLIDVGGLGSKPNGEEKEEGLAIKDELESFNENDGLDGLLGPGVCGTTATTPSDAIVVVESIDHGVSFGSPEVVSMIEPFDQGTTEYSFRSNSYPTMTADQNELVYLAWTTRGFGTGSADPSPDTGDARIVVSVSDNGALWSAPQAIDRPEVPGHQIKPSLTHTGGKLLLTYYDFRRDVSGIFDRFIADWPSAVPTPRHTVDVRAAVAEPGPTPVFTDYTSVLDPVPSTQASRYAHFIGGEGLSDAESVQLEYSAPALPMFKGGTVPFFSDYLDTAPSPPFVPDGFGGWEYNIDPAATPVAHVVWTDDRDVVGPPDGDWTSYIPPAHANSGGASIFDPNQTVPVCDPQTADVDRTRMRNQNIYTARLSEGLYVAVPGNSRPLGTVPGSTTGELLQRAFVVFVQNATEVERSFELSIMDQPTQGEASFHQFALEETTHVTIEAYSSASRTVFVKSSVESHPLPSVEVDVTEINYPGNTPLHSTVLINPDPYNPPPVETSLADGEIYNPSIWNPSIWNPSIWNPSIWNPSIWNPSIWNPSIWNPSIWNPSIWNPSLVNPSIWNPSIWNPSIWNPSIWNPSIWNPAISNPSIWNPSIWNPSIWNTSISEVTDVTWMVKNDGNATAAYSFNLLADQVPPDHAFQLMVYRVYTTPVADGCELTVEGQQETLVNVLDPDFTAPDLLDPNTMDPDVPTFFLGPGEEVFITLRVHDPDQTDDVDFYPEEVQVAVVAQGVETEVLLDGGDQQPYAIPDISVPISSPMDDGRMQHTTTPLPDGTILLVGGYNDGGTLDTAEIYDPVNRSFVPVPDLLASPRAYHTATELNDGTVLIVGGSSSAPGAEIYDPVSQTFTQTIGEVQVFRGSHQATLLHDGRVLITGGNAGVTPVNSAEVYDPSNGSFTLVGNMSSARWEHSATMLSTGEVLVAGGFDGVADLDTAELFDPTTDTFSDVPGTMTDPRRFHSSTLLPDGTVLLAGGLFDSSLVAVASADVYDRATNSLAPAGSLIRARAAHTATLLADGKVLLTGGQNMIDGSLSLSSHIELYDWSTGSFIEKGHMTMARSEHQAVRMPDGKVLLTGGATYGAPITTGTDVAEYYVPARLAAITFTGDLADTRTHHAATLLPNGTVLVTGGTRQDLQGRASAELFDPALEEFSPAGDMLIQRTSHTATRLLDGRVLIAGGSTTHDWSTGITAAEIYDPSLGTFSATGSLNAARSAHRATLLTDGRVLITGGLDPSTGFSLNGAEIYDPVSGIFTLTLGTMTTDRFMHTATRLTDGRVLVAGGVLVGAGPTVSLDGAEIFDPATDSFTSTGSMDVPRTHHAAIRLTDGRVLVTGGSDDLGGSAYGTAEVFDSATGSFSYTNGELNLARFNHESTRLPDGVVLITGGLTDGSISLSSVERFDPVTGTFEASDAMNRWRSRHTATSLENGQVLLTSGWEVSGSEIGLDVPGFSAEIYNPPPIDESLVQRNALIALYNATNGSGWTNNTNWRNLDSTDFNEPGTECTWWGVTCDVGRVKSIFIRDNNLTGTIPPEIGDISSLYSLDLLNNRLSGAIPQELGNLVDLHVLALGSGLIPSAISGKIPRGLGRLSNLEQLFIGNTALAGEIPPELGNLSNLEYLGLIGNQLDGEIPVELGKLSNLKWLALHVNELTGVIPGEIGNLRSLESITLDRNLLTGPIPLRFGDLENLENLDLERNQLSGEIPTALGGLNNLRRVDLTDNLLTGEIPPELGSLGSLEYLDLDQNRLQGAIPPELGGLGSLRFLNLQGNMLSGSIPAVLQNLTGLTLGNLDIRWNALYSTDQVLTDFLNSRQDGGVWESTQTIAPTDMTPSLPAENQLNLSWTPIPYTTGDGGYEVHVSTVSGGPYASPGRTSDKTVDGITVGGLQSDTVYYFVIRTITEAGSDNKNTVVSEFSTEVSASTATGVAAIPTPEREGLIALYNSTNGPGWTNSTNWLGPVGSECTWYGVNCGPSDAYVSGIDLDSNQLAGSIPSAIGDLTYLEVLDLSGNQLSGPIPIEIGNLFYLRGLVLQDNTLNGGIPAELGDLPLDYLVLSNNQLSGGIPATLGNLSTIDDELSLDNNQLTGSIPPELGNLIYLGMLDLSHNQLSGSIPPELGEMTNLYFLYLGYNQLSGGIPAQLEDLSNLQDLDLAFNDLSGSIPAALGSLASLENLWLLGNDLTGSIPSELGNLTSLEQLWLQYNELSGSIPPELGNLLNLTWMDLNTNHLSGNIPPQLGNLASLTQLVLKVNQLNGNIPPELSNLTNLTSLALDYNELTGTIPTELGNLPLLRTLWLNDNQLTGSIPPELGSLLVLERLHLQDNQLSGTIPWQIGDLDELIHLKLEGNQLGGAIPANLENLVELEDNGGLDIRWNALFSADPGLTTFLNSKQLGTFWENSQTVCPTNLSVVSPTDNTLTLSWTPISYTSDAGGYDVYYSTASWGSFTLYGRTADKTAESMVVEGLNPSDSYYFFLKTVTDPHPFNQNSVTSTRQTPTVSGITSAMPLVITTIQLPYGLVDVAYSQTLSATGGQGTRIWGLAPTSPPLPPGMDLHSAGAIIGTPSATGSYPIQVQVTDDSQTTRKDLVVTVNHPNLTITSQPKSATAGDNVGPIDISLSAGGNPVDGAAINLTLGNSPCLGATLLGLTTATTDEFGQASFADIRVSDGGWGFTVIVSLVGDPTQSSTSESFDVEGFCSTGNPNVARGHHTSTLLPSGRVLVAGGQDVVGPLFAAEVYDPMSGSFTHVGDMAVARSGHAAELMADGTVLVVGYDGSGVAVGEIFEEVSDTFSPTVGLSGNDSSPSTATSLPNGRLLVIKGYELFDPADGSFTASGGTPTIRRTHAHTATLLLDGRVLITGGYLSDVADKRIPELYDPATDTVSSSSAYMSAERMYHTATLLPDGRVLIAGGTEGPGSLDSAEVYDPLTDAVVPTGPLNSPRFNHSATLLANGKVLITGGHDANTGTTLSSAEIFDPSTGSFSDTDSMDTPRFSAGATRLQNDAVLVSGGSDVQSAEVFWPIGDEMMWTRQFGSIHVDFAADVSASPLGVYVGGSVSGALPGQTSVGAVDGYLRKYDPAGTELWTRQFGSTENDQVWAVSIHASGVYVTGHTLGVFPGQSSAGESDAFIRKYDHAGTELWTRQFGTSETEMPFGIAVDASGVYLVGDTSGTFPGQPLAGPPDAFVRKYDHSGTELWTRQFGNTAFERGRAIAVDSSGVYIAGHVGGTLPGQVFEGGAYDAFVRKYDSAGNEIWTRQFGTSEDDLIGSISVDASGLYVAGYTAGTLAGQTSSGGPDGFVRRYDTAGFEIWTRQFGTSNTDQAFAVSVRSSGIYVSGGTQGAFPGQISSGGEDAFVRKYGFAGNQVWTHQFGGTADVEVKAVSVDASGLYVCGLSNGTLPGQISEGGTDSFLVKLVQ